MKSRYSAYAAGESAYIIATTDARNPEYQEDREVWREDILLFCRDTVFLGLSILDFDEKDEKATVTFEARLDSGVMRERSRFVKKEGRWLYLDGVVS